MTCPDGDLLAGCAVDSPVAVCYHEGRKGESP